MTDIEIITKVAEYTGLSFNKLAKEIGLTSPQTFYDIKAGKHGISKELAEKIQARYLNISEAWLLTGNGEMLVAENPTARITEMVVVGSTEEIAVDIEALQNELNITTSQLATIINDSEEYLLKCQGKLLPRHIVALELNYGEERISKYVTLPN
jgi:plasmid maintenance system antidote protein VapI